MRRLMICLLGLIGFLFCFNACLFAASGTATAIGTDTTTQGNWMGTYGTVGYYIPSGPSLTPSDGSTFNPGAASLWTWGTNVASASALKTSGGDIASGWYNNLGTSAPSLTLDVIIPAMQSQTVAVYLLDYDKQGRSESVSVTDASNNPLSGPTAVSGTNFANGEYLLYTITGEVHINVTFVNGPNAVANGIFFGVNSSMPPPATASAYFTRFSNQTPSTTLTQMAKLTLPAGTYLIRAAASLQNGAVFAGLNDTCALFHTSISVISPDNLLADDNPLPGAAVPNINYVLNIANEALAIAESAASSGGGGSGTAVPATPTNGSQGTAYSEETAQLTATDTIIWACVDNLGGGSIASGSLTATPYQSINVQ